MSDDERVGFLVRGVAPVPVGSLVVELGQEVLELGQSYVRLDVDSPGRLEVILLASDLHLMRERALRCVRRWGARSGLPNLVCSVSVRQFPTFLVVVCDPDGSGPATVFAAHLCSATTSAGEVWFFKTGTTAVVQCIGSNSVFAADVWRSHLQQIQEATVAPGAVDVRAHTVDPGQMLNLIGQDGESVLSEMVRMGLR